jgi:hypothetical protein
MALLAASCSKSKCEKFAEIEVKCQGSGGADDKAAIKGLCESVDTDPAFGAEAAKTFKGQVDCALKNENDCTAYKSCVEGLVNAK